MTNPTLILTIVALTLLSASGCQRGGAFDTAAVSGRVSCDGQPIRGGKILFRPVAPEPGQESGKSSIGHLNDQGEFSMLTTYDLGDGAVIGKHRIQVIPEGYAVDDDDEATSQPVQPCPCIKRGGFTDHTVEVQSDGQNDLVIELSSR